MKIGPGGYAYYGPTVPDIYILGGYILGKDVSWWGINFAYKFQLVFVFIYGGLAWLSYQFHVNKRLLGILQVLRTGLLLCFVPWILFYQSHVQNNSDGADLTAYPHIGWIAYLGLAGIQVLVFKHVLLNKPQHGM